jgi:acyl carrier protein
VATTEADVRQAVAEILAEIGVEPESIAGPAVLGRDLELDSTDAVEVGLELKRRFNVSVRVQVKGDETVASLVGLVIAEIEQAPPETETETETEAAAPGSVAAPVA